MKKQVVIINGGSCFDSYSEYIKALKKRRFDFKRMRKIGWKQNMQIEAWGKFEVLAPRMPNPENARYKEWEIWFKKIVPFLEKRVVLVGHSLGGIFLAKYLAKNKFSKKILATFLISAPFNESPAEPWFADFKLPRSLKKIEKQSDKIFIFHSEDDPVVPVGESLKYSRALPTAKMMIFKKRGHFNQSSFPELYREIKKVFKK